MKDKIVFATHNKHKLKEVSELLKEYYEVIGLTELGCLEEIPETADTFKGNASLKSHYVYKNYGISCFSDDSGLEVEALNGEPGVYSARYAGDGHDDKANNLKLLKNLEGVTNRKAQFRSVISLVLDEKEYFFEGFVYGTLLKELRGTNGFGYDPMFVPNGYDQSFGELSDSVKNNISHRANAIKKLVDFLSTK